MGNKGINDRPKCWERGDVELGESEAATQGGEGKTIRIVEYRIMAGHQCL